MADESITVEIDGRPLQARKGAMLIEVADAAGIHIPRFCYHKKLSVAANCRMCLVEVEKVAKPLPACATPVAPGMKVHTRSALALGAQKSVMEFLLINHPLDCPICDQGGECELQDVAMGYGSDVSRFQERKRVVQDKDIGSLVATDMTRCIHCTRCVRFGEEIAGVRELGATGRGEHMEIGTYVARSMGYEMSGNVIDLCPVGALTSKPFRFTARPWELTQRAGVAGHDGVGSNLYLHLRRGRVMRVVPRDNEAVNETWISDRDRFSYQGLYAEDRLATPAVRRDGKWFSCDWETALDTAAAGLRRVIEARGAPAIGGLGGASATLEELYLLQALLRGLGSASVDHRLGEVDSSDDAAFPRYPSLGRAIEDLEHADAVLVVGSHLRKEQPILNHRLRKAALRGAAILYLNPVDYEVNYRALSYAVAPGRVPGVLAAIAAALPTTAASDAGWSALLASAPADATAVAIAERLGAARRPVVLAGELAMAHPRAALVRALAGQVAARLGVPLGLMPAGANAAGAWLAGAVPHRMPGGAAAPERGRDAAAMLGQGMAAYVLFGVEPELEAWDGAAAQRALEGADFVVACSAYRTPALERYAHVLLPVAAGAESAGTLVNLEGRWQSFDAAATPPGEARPGWKVLRVLGNRLALGDFEFTSVEEIRAAVRQRCGALGPDAPAAWPPPADLGTVPPGLTRIGERAAYGVDPVVRRATALQRTADGAAGVALRVHPETAAALGLVEGGVAQARQTAAESASLPVRLDAGVPKGCVWVPAGVAATAGLGARFGAIDVARSGDGVDA